jgi:hypothetical protein
MSNFQTPPLQALRIPEGWRVDYNNAFYEIDINEGLIPQAERWWLFKQDMLQMTHEIRNRLLDLGFLPEGDFANGSYKLVLYEGDFNGRLLHTFRTRDRKRLVAEIERILAEVTRGAL